MVTATGRAVEKDNVTSWLNGDWIIPIKNHVCAWHFARRSQANSI